MAGTGSGGFSGDGGPANAAKIYYPYGLTTDTAGNVFMADQGNWRIRKVTMATGIITTITEMVSPQTARDSILAITATLNNPIEYASIPQVICSSMNL